MTGSRFSIATTGPPSARSSSPALPRPRSRRAITATTCRRRFSSSRSSLPRRFKATSGHSRAWSRFRPRSRPRFGQSGHHRRLRHELLRGAGRQILDRTIRAHSGRHRCRERVPLPRAGARAGRPGAVHQPVRRDRRHAGRPAPRARGAAAASPWSSMSRPARWRARPTCCSRPMPGRRSGSPRPRRSRASFAVLAALAANLARAKGRLTAGGRTRDRRPSAGSAGGAQRRARP